VHLCTTARYAAFSQNSSYLMAVVGKYSKCTLAYTASR